MGEVVSFFANPLLWKIVIGYWMFSAAVDALPPVTEKSSAPYQFAAKFLHGFAGNLSRVAKRVNLPGQEQ